MLIRKIHNFSVSYSISSKAESESDNSIAVPKVIQIVQFFKIP